MISLRVLIWKRLFRLRKKIIVSGELIFLHMVIGFFGKCNEFIDFSKALLQDIFILITTNVRDNIYFLNSSHTGSSWHYTYCWSYSDGVLAFEIMLKEYDGIEFLKTRENRVTPELLKRKGIIRIKDRNTIGTVCGQLKISHMDLLGNGKVQGALIWEN